MPQTLSPTISKYSVCNTEIAATTYSEVLELVFDKAKSSHPLLISALAVHGLIESRMNQDFHQILSEFDLLLPDGQPLRISLNHYYAAGLRARVYGPELMLKICEKAGENSTPIYLYGSSEEVVENLAIEIHKKYSNTQIAGYEPSVFRHVSEDEMKALANRIQASGAQIVFLGLGCPLQEKFAFRLNQYLSLPILCVGAAFDFHSGNKKMAPKWMQDHALEWLYRLMQEPRRLVKRYFITNSLFFYFILRDNGFLRKR